MLRIFGRKKEQKKDVATVKKMTDLEQLVGDDKETYDALTSVMFLDPRKIGTSIKEAVDKAKKSEKETDFVSAKMWYEIAGGLAIFEGDAKRVIEYYTGAERVSGRKYLILKTPEKAVAKAQEYYKKYLLD